MTEGNTAVAVRDEAQPPAPVIEERSLLSAIVDVARDPKLDVAKLDALLKMQAELEKRQAERAAIEAFAEMSAAMPRVTKKGAIDLGRGKPIPFAKWEDMDKVIRPLLAKHGFTLSFDSEAIEGGLLVRGELMHRGGHVRRASMPLPFDTGPGRNQLQARGSTLAYGKRYCAEMLLNIVREGDDDDGTKGGTRFATDDEVAELQTLIKETGTNEERFCNTLNVAHLGELPVTSVAVAKNMLLAKKAARKP